MPEGGYVDDGQMLNTRDNDVIDSQSCQSLANMRRNDPKVLLRHVCTESGYGKCLSEKSAAA